MDTRANITVVRLMMDFHSQLCQLQAGDISLKRSVLHDAAQVYRFRTMNHQGEVRYQMKQTNKEVNKGQGGVGSVVLQLYSFFYFPYFSPLSIITEISSNHLYCCMWTLTPLLTAFVMCWTSI